MPEAESVHELVDGDLVIDASVPQRQLLPPSDFAHLEGAGQLLARWTWIL